ncbi:hypothetical protein [Luteimonas sp. R10]|uniref:hypothetical protein n=1 Tax=Luteimonas sp. R10 TaxID=3108176 RepID=UPI00308A683B|nr:hypothetical protein U3649_03450 [Luteimonas sp. R10]
MIEIREVDGRFEVFCEDWHWEVFEGALGAQQAAIALASNILSETGTRPAIVAPWGDLIASSGKAIPTQPAAGTNYARLEKGLFSCQGRGTHKPDTTRILQHPKRQA